MFNICRNKTIDIIKNKTINNSSIVVKQLWVKFPKGFGNPDSFQNRLDVFYKTLGNNIPRYLQYEGTGMQYIFCVDKVLDTTTICTNYGIDRFSTSEFTTEKEKFNYQLLKKY